MYCLMDCSWQGLLVLKIHTFQVRLDTFIFVSGKKKKRKENGHLKCNQKAKSWHLAREMATFFPVKASFWQAKTKTKNKTFCGIYSPLPSLKRKDNYLEKAI